MKTGISKSLILTLTGMGLAFVMSIGAIADERYYSVTLPVSDRAERTRERAISRGLAIVLRRVTGRPELPDEPVLNTALASAQGYATRFGYTRLDDGTSRLTVHYDPRGVRELIAAAGLTAWSLDRPRVMAWVLVTDERGESILDASSEHAISSAMRAMALEFGVPLVFPLMDMDERFEVPPTLLRGLFLDPLRQASLRYNARFMLVGRVEKAEAGQWTGIWTLAQPGAPLSERTFTRTATPMARAATGFVLQELSRRFALDMQQETRVRLSVEGIHALADYVELFAYLRNLDGVERAELREMSRELLTLDLWLATTWDGFLDLLGEERRLSPVFVVGLAPGEQRLAWRTMP